MKANRGVEVQLFLTLAQVRMSGQPHALAILPQGKKPPVSTE
jgi:hypothetical protein